MLDNQQNTVVTRPHRSSNLELYRIVCMLMIVAHHYVANSGLATTDGPLVLSPTSAQSIYLALFGAWGKTGINCFLMITGYFMCTSRITVRKFLKLLGQIYLYKVVIFFIFLTVGYEHISLLRIAKLIMPTWGFTNNFVGCFIGFWLTIPFLNILINSISKRQHEVLLLLMFFMYSFLGSIPKFPVAVNYVTWFGIIYLVASYIRLYPQPVFERRCFWGYMTLLNFGLAIFSIIGLLLVFGSTGAKHFDFFVSDSNKFFAVTIAVSSFLWFKNLNIRHSKIINAFGAATFGVLLIHANSDAMRLWLWKDTFDVVGHYSLPIGDLMLYSFGVVLAVFIVCNLIDQLRIATLEKWFLNWYDKKVSAKADALVNKILQKQ